MFNLVITDRNVDWIETWKNVLQDLSFISFCHMEIQEFLHTEILDAFIMRSIFAIDHYKISAIHGKSQIINTEDDQFMPNFVITTPFYLGDNVPTIDKWDYAEWAAIFGAINEFNMIHQNRIANVGIELSFLYGYRHSKTNLEEEAKALRKVYTDCCALKG